MKTTEERLTIVEHRVAENARGIAGLRDAIVDLGRRMDRRFEAVDRRFEAMDRRFEAIDQRFEAINQTMDRRFETMDQKLSRQFFWLVSTMIGTMVAILLAILTR